MPAGKTTVPPPAMEAASIAALTAGESIVLPSPVAPKERTSKESGFPDALLWVPGALCAGAAGVFKRLTEPPTIPRPAIFRNSLRNSSILHSHYLSTLWIGWPRDRGPTVFLRERPSESDDPCSV